MIRDDWVLKQVEALAKALAALRARLARGEVEAAATDAGQACQELVGASLELVDRLPAAAVQGFASGLEPRVRPAFADLLEAAAEVAAAAGDHELAAQRRDKARAVRG